MGGYMAAWIWPGSRWWKCDLHVHTSESPDVDDTVTAADVVSAAVDAGLDVLAVTDHNSGRGFDAIRDAAAFDGRGLVVLPGTELTVGGVHLLALFPDGNADDVTAFLGACGITGAKIGQEDALAGCSIIEAIKLARTHNGICIASHADDVKGILKVATGQELKGIVLCDALSAVEVKVNDAALLAFTDNSKSEYRRPGGPLAQTLSSDAHKAEQIGSRATWLKMSRPTLEGLRLALQDGELSVQADRDASKRPNRHASSVIESITVSETKLMGRGTPVEFRLNPWFNAVIGGRGTGKSTFVEMSRIALDREGEVPNALAPDYASLRTISEGRGLPGLLLPESTIDVVYRKDDERYKIHWDAATDTRALFKDDGTGAWQPAEGDIPSRFPVRIFSQKQIFELARDPKALMLLVDNAVRERDELLGFDLFQAEQSYCRASQDTRVLRAEIAEEPVIRGALEDVRRRIRVFETAGHKEVAQAYARRSNQKAEVAALGRKLGDAVDAITKMAAGLKAPDVDRSAFDPADPSDKEALAIIDAVRTVFGEAQAKVQSVVDDVKKAKTGLEGDIAASQLARAADDAKKKFEELKATLQAAGGGDLDDYEALVQRESDLQAALAEIVEKKPGLATQEAKLAARALDLEAERKKLTAERQEFLAEVLGASPHIRMTVVPFGAKDAATSSLRKVLRRDDAAFAKDIDGAISELYDNYPSEVAVPTADDTRAFEFRLAALKAGLNASVTGDGRPRDHADARFGSHLAGLPNEVADEVDTWYPDDSLSVVYSPKGDGKDFTSLEQGSPGQKTAALLAFVLSHGSQPIILDQPEDDLENRLIYELVVRGVRSTKQSRQVIVVTHNANVVVNGDAEQVVLLDAPHGRSEIAASGSLQEDDVRENICDVLEGGREAFELRYRRIGGV